MSSHGTKRTDISDGELLIDPPTFRLPDDFYTNRSRYELWSVRAPIRFNVSALDGQRIQLSSSSYVSEDEDTQETAVATARKSMRSSVKTGKLLSTVQVDSQTFGFVLGDDAEFDKFRILVKDDSRKSINRRAGKEMKPLVQPFDKHINLTDMAPTVVTDVDYAPSCDSAPKINEAVKYRIPYTAVEQVRGLKRRWNMFGSFSMDDETLWKKQQGRWAEDRAKLSVNVRKSTVKVTNVTNDREVSSPEKKASSHHSDRSEKKSSRKQEESPSGKKSSRKEHDSSKKEKKSDKKSKK